MSQSLEGAAYAAPSWLHCRCGWLLQSGWRVGVWWLLAQQLKQLDVRKQTGQWALKYRQVQAAEERLRQAEQDPRLPQTSPTEFAKQQSEFAKQQAAPVSKGGTASPADEGNEADERQAQLRAIASDLLYWKGGLKVLKQARLPKWRGCFQWQIEAKVEALQAAYSTLRAEGAKPDGYTMQE